MPHEIVNMWVYSNSYSSGENILAANSEIKGLKWTDVWFNLPLRFVISRALKDILLFCKDVVWFS